ncbi:hypothetical protein GCM10023321_08490 [Pseudonocardia eucalypti]|uniref:Acyl-CoA dehydrogenase n=1 Tax=Pseudonocardia eucalypti TaxID=648755 RepID=A0ABP9PK95_9PSEU|nr:hypothetical protein [Pseudonocardia eucalypti]
MLLEQRVRAMLAGGELTLPLPRAGATARRWARLADWGRCDLEVARLAEGHADAVAILSEAGLLACADGLYGVWAARPGGVGPRLTEREGQLRVDGLARYCSGARMLDRALLVVEPQAAESAPLLVEVAIRQGGVTPDPDSWRAAAMAGTQTWTVSFTDVPVHRLVGGPGWYTERPGFAAGGGGVAAVWWGGAAGLLDRAFESARVTGVDPHQCAQLGELHALLAACQALLRATADELDAVPEADHRMALATARAAVEHGCRDTLDRLPRATGPGPLGGDRWFAAQLANLQVYLRQHHGERDFAELATELLAARG